MKQKLLLLLVTLAFLLPARLSAFESGGIYYELQWDDESQAYNGVYVASSPYDNKYSGDIVIPSSVEYEGQTYPVTSIGNYAFDDCADLTSVEIPNSITSIGDRSFQSCRALTSMDIPDSVTSIGEYAFWYCVSLKSIKISTSITSIKHATFADCSSLTNIELPNSIISIEGVAFSGCSSLTSVEIPNSVTSIGSSSFSNCSSLNSVEIPNSVTSIGDGAFQNCTSLTSVVIPNSVSSIEDYTFRECKALASVEIPNSVTSIGALAFYSCKSLTSVQIPNSVTSIGQSAFQNCTSLTSVEIPNSVTSIQYGTFQECSSLTSVALPDSITSIGDYAFYYCSSLTSVEIPNSVTSIGNSAFIRCSSLTSIELPNSVTSIGDYAFSGCSSLTTVEIPNSVTSIGNSAFSGCSSLSSVEIANSVTSIGENAFSYCDNLRLVVIQSPNVKFGSNIFGESWSSKPWYVFAPEGLDCSALKCNVRTFDPATTIFMADGTILTDNGKTLYFVPVYAGMSYEIPEGVTKIPAGAFGSMDGAAFTVFDTLTIPSTIEEIEADAFNWSIQIEKVNFTDWSKWYANVKLGNIYANPYWNSKPYVGGVQMVIPELPEEITEIPDYINYGLQFKDEIELPRSIKRIGAYAFYNNKELYSVILPVSLEEIGESAFEGCELLENPAFPSGLKKIENGAYKKCTSITEIALPEGVSMLGEIAEPDPTLGVSRVKGVFEGCSALEKAVVAVDIDYIADNLFKGCKALDKIYFPLQLKTIGNGAFEKCITLDEITFPATLESIGRRAFMGDNEYRDPEPQFGHISKLVIPDGVKEIGSYAFAYQSIANLSIGKSLESIADSAFYANPELKVIEFSEGLKKIGTGTFANAIWCNSYSYIGSVKLPSTVTAIGNYAFSGCYISELVVPDKVETLGTATCGRPSSLTLGSAVKDIAADAFDFEKLYTIRLKAHMPPTLSDAFPLTPEQNDQLTLIVNQGRHDTYNTNARWKQIDRIIEDGESEVVIYLNGEYSLAEEIRIQSGYMPSVITRMKVNGPLTATDLRVIKENMISLTSLDISGVTNVTAIPESQFAGSLITSIVLPSNLETIGDGAFNNCSLLSLSEIPATVKTIGSNAFYGCPGVNIKTLPAALESIGYSAFSNSGMTEVVAGSLLSEIGSNAFSNCMLLERADLSAAAINAIADNLFSGCTELDEVLLPASVETIGYGAFSGTALRNIDFASEVATIGDNAFSNNRRLVSATLPESVTRVGSNLFSNCPRLISVSMPMATTSVGAAILSSDRKLANLSCAATEAPDAESGAFNDVRYRYVTLTVPTLSFRKYLSAPQWGKFENMKNTLQVNIGGGVNVTNAAENEYQDMLEEDELEAAQEAAAQQSGEITPARAMRRAAARAKSVQNFAIMFDGAQLMSSTDAGANRVFITPEPGVKVTSILLDDKELLSEFDGYSLLLPEGCTGALKIITDAPDPVKVESITLSETKVKLTFGETKELKATVNPENADDKRIRWESSNPEYVTVDKNGVITANNNWSTGTSIITATAMDGSGVKATCEVTVGYPVYVMNIEVSESNVNMNPGDTKQLTATVYPEDADNKSVAWTSSDTSVVTVTENGLIEAVAEGYATITVMALDGSGATGYCYVTVSPKYIDVAGITLNATELSLTEGEAATLSATVDPSDATDKTVTWSSSDYNVAYVDSEGNVSAMSAGTAVITATASNGMTASCTVTVATNIVSVESIILDYTELTLDEGQTWTLYATITPDNATDMSVTWSTSDSSIASVDSFGNVTAMSAGTAVITATASNGKTASCFVMVLPTLASSLTIDPTEWNGVEGDMFTITATVLPDNTANKNVMFESSDSNVASVDGDGNVVILKEGTCVITVSTVDGSGLTAECVITSMSGVEAIFADPDAEVDVYD
ncbi:MAG: leucine-rich repeat protein, partial [Muribaculaceae bacterium]|nr:leucine-rich repeat protein [Muribaculaceae bacterium]